MEQQLRTMWQELDQRKSLLTKQKLECIKTIYNGLLNNKPIGIIHKELKESTISKNVLSYFLAVSNRALVKVQRVEKNAKKGVFLGVNGQIMDVSIKELTSIWLYDMIKRGMWSANSQKIINHEMNRLEERKKSEILESELKESTATKVGERFEDNSPVFWVASSHNDSAKDHVNYQGKIYYNANYDHRDERINNFIKMNGLQSVQWVTSDPVWFVTRPHCRHYFIHYTYNQIASGNYHIPHRKIGMRRLKTQKFMGVENDKARLAIEYYENRKNELEELNKIHSNYIIRADLQKCKDLIAKWKREI